MSQPQKDSLPSKTELLKSILNIGKSNENHKEKDNVNDNHKDNVKLYKDLKTNLEKTELLKKALRIRTEFTESEIKTQLEPPMLRRPSREWNKDNNEDDL